MWLSGVELLMVNMPLCCFFTTYREQFITKSGQKDINQMTLLDVASLLRRSQNQFPNRVAIWPFVKLFTRNKKAWPFFGLFQMLTKIVYFRPVLDKSEQISNIL